MSRLPKEVEDGTYDGGEHISTEVMKKILKRADEMRHDPRTQALYSQKEDPEWFYKVTDNFHRQLLLDEFGYSKDVVEDVLDEFYSCRWHYQNHPEMQKFLKTLTHVKYDITGDGPIEPGQDITTLTKGVQLHNLDGQPIDFGDYVAKSQNEGKPLVIFAGSMTWPPFRLTVPTVNKLYNKYKDQALFLSVYILEAHAKDQWPLGNFVVVEQHKTLQDRITMAKKYIKETGWQLEMIVDNMQNQFQWLFWVHPERFYIIDAGKLEYKARPTDQGYYVLQEVDDWLSKKFQSKTITWKN